MTWHHTFSWLVDTFWLAKQSKTICSGIHYCIVAKIWRIFEIYSRCNGLKICIILVLFTSKKLINKSVKNILKIQSFTMTQIVTLLFLCGNISSRQTVSESEWLQVPKRESIFQLFIREHVQKNKFMYGFQIIVKYSRFLELGKDLLYKY